MAKNIPAFPCYYNGDYKPQEGMSLLDYFAAHAPVEPQVWFQPVFDTPRPKPIWEGDDGQRYETWQDAQKENGEEGYSDVNKKAADDWDREKKKQRLIQWPYAWAHEVLKTRESTK